jgi:hypothetical protein
VARVALAGFAAFKRSQTASLSLGVFIAVGLVPRPILALKSPVVVVAAKTPALAIIVIMEP